MRSEEDQKNTRRRSEAGGRGRLLIFTAGNDLKSDFESSERFLKPTNHDLSFYSLLFYNYVIITM